MRSSSRIETLGRGGCWPIVGFGMLREKFFGEGELQVRVEEVAGFI